MSMKFYLPVGQPGLVSAATDANSYRQVLPYGGGAFGGDCVSTTYGNPERPLTVKYRSVVAMAPGVIYYDADTSMIRLQLMYTTHKALHRLFGGELPVPIRINYGPLNFHSSGRTLIALEPDQGGNASAWHSLCDAGTVIGDLIGPTFTISMQDQNGYYLDCRRYFQLFNEHGLWDLPDGVRCPLIDPTDLTGPVEIAGPIPVATGESYFRIAGGSLATAINNPADPLLPEYFSFLSRDEIQVSVKNLPTGLNGSLRVTDVSDPMYRTKQTPRWFEPPAARTWNIVLQQLRKPHHLAYKKQNGKKQPGQPLAYSLRIAAGNPERIMTSTITQDGRDVVRQEYLFHSEPFQSGTDPLDIPARVRLERNIKPKFVKHFAPKELQRSNYGPKSGNWLLNRTEIYHVAEYMRREFARILTEQGGGTLPAQISSFGVKVNSSWRNPERNEVVNGARRSNHQFGRALDLKSVQFNWAPSLTSQRKALNLAMFNAGRIFLEALIALNGGSSCTSVEILFERGWKLLWHYNATSSGSITSMPGDEYAEEVGAQPANKEAAIEKAAAYVSHVHIGWKPKIETTPLILPDIGNYDFLPSTLPNVYRNIILIGSEADSVDEDDRLPLMAIAESLKRHLKTVDPGTTTKIHVVSDAIQFLEHCNAFRQPTYKIKNFFSFSHAWLGGLVLLNYPSGTDYETVIHNSSLFEELNFLYADDRAQEDSEFDESALADDFVLPYGPNDYTQIKTHQIRISNLTFLPADAKERVRNTFAEAENICIVGSRTSDLPDFPALNFTCAFAELVKKTVHGAAYYCKVFQWQDDGEWDGVNLNAGDPLPESKNPTVLIPGSLGGLQYIKYTLFMGRETPDIPEIPETMDLVKVYKHMLSPCHPKEE